ncbi:transcriptional regulator, TetR family [Emticicia oligotrophica DSM 17448]|uniref:Transcriptional regulator, TetR family n=1 Tax=Emticicia oligotrophica (strain DSM 17448 / CIP 109782 / MTCC 6937 / GPTSA100-15) TaxID=929562 RepID=A0ABM5N4W8_EMTOG|nr:TetR/AcrR family transcriptional regulator [Emticicia oligotrophica]AFK04473.1 transcriptional regulator, TetR family [Emticicia oligotrophica DSM 17448]
MSKEQKILDTALKLFVEDGFQGTPTSKIAKEAGVANGTLFHYFATKETLIQELYIHVKNELNQYLLSVIDPNDDIKATTKKAFIYAILWSLENPEKFHFTQQVHFSPHVAKIPEEVVQEQTKLYTQLIESAKSQGLLKPMPTDLIFTLVHSQMMGIFQYLLTKPKGQQHEIIDQGFELVWTLISI